MGQENPTSDTLLGYALDGFPIYGPINDPSRHRKDNENLNAMGKRLGKNLEGEGFGG